MFSAQYKDMTELSYELTKRLVYSKPEDISVANTMDFQVNNVMVASETCDYAFDLKDVWVTKNRWSSLVRQYIDPIALEGFLGQVEAKLRGKKRGIAFLRTQQVAKRTTKTNNKEWRRWGSCMLGFAYTALPKPTLTLHSRTTYLGYIGQIDLALAHVLAREIAERVGITVSDMSFVWHINGAQFHSFKSLAWFFQNERDRRFLEEKAHTKKLQQRAPVLYRAQVRYKEYQDYDERGVLYCDMSFSQQLRIRRRWHTEVYGPDHGLPFEGGTRLQSASMAKVAAPLPSVPVAKLDFGPLRTIKRPESEELIQDSEDKAGIMDLTDDGDEELEMAWADDDGE
jgi:hypothetical protein